MVNKAKKSFITQLFTLQGYELKSSEYFPSDRGAYVGISDKGDERTFRTAYITFRKSRSKEHPCRYYMYITIYQKTGISNSTLTEDSVRLHTFQRFSEKILNDALLVDFNGVKILPCHSNKNQPIEPGNRPSYIRITFEEGLPYAE